MSQWSASQSLRVSRAQRHLHEVAQRPDPRQRGVSQPSKASGYTIAHAGRQVRLGPVAFWIAVGTVVIMAGWSAVTATYFAFRDDVLKSLIAHQAEQQFAYEDRIAELRAQIDRTTSRQLLDQEQFEQKLDELVRRQASLETRATALNSVADPTTTGSIKSALRGTPDAATTKTQALGNTRVLGDSLLTPQRLDRGTLLEPDRTPRKGGKSADIGGKLSRIEASLDKVERRQTAALDQMQERYEGKARKLRGVLAELGLKLDTAPAGVGGPFVPVKLPAENQGFERALTRINIAHAYTDRLNATLVSVPLRKPVTGEIDLSSQFGVR